MQCNQCGHVSDWIGGDDDWEPVGTAGPRAMYECGECGHSQRARG
jgi:uncharacterized Zn finger protein